MRALNAGYEGLWIRGGRCGLLGSSGGWRAADTGGAEEAFDAREAHVVDSGEGGGGGAVAVVSDQFGDVALVEAPRRLHGRFALGLAARTEMASAMVWQCRRSAACTECE